MTSKKRYETLLNKGLDWYLVDYADGKPKLVHKSAFSAVLECGHAPARSVEPANLMWMRHFQQSWQARNF